MRFIIYILLLLLPQFAQGAVIPDKIQKKLQALNSKEPMSSQTFQRQVKDLFDWSTSNQRPDVTARLLSRYGVYLYDLGFYDLSSDIFRCASYFITPDDERVMVFTEACRAISDFHNGSREEAEKTLLNIEKEVGKMPKNVQQQILLYTIYGYLGVIYSETGREQRAYQSYDKALKMSQAVGDKNSVCSIVSRMCKLSFYNQHVDSLLQGALTVAMEIENNEVIYDLLMAKAQMAYKKADYQRALIELEDAETYAHVSLDNDSVPIYTKSMTDYLFLRSRCYSGLNEYARAFETMTSYLDMRDRKLLSKERIHNEHWTLCHDIIAQCELYRAGQLAKEQARQSRLWLLIGIVVVVALALALALARRMKPKVVDSPENQAKLDKMSQTVNQLNQQVGDMGRKVEHAEQQNAELKQRAADMQQQNDHLEQQNALLEKDVDYLTGRATLYSLLFNARNELLDKLRDLVREGYKLTPVQQEAHLKKISAAIGLSQFKEKKNEKTLMDIIYERNKLFFEHLNERCSTLTENDKRLALYIHFDISTRDIAQMTGQQVKTVSMARFRLRKDLGYVNDEEMNAALKSM